MGYESLGLIMPGFSHSNEASLRMWSAVDDSLTNNPELN
jgi:hypothetical protein